MSMSIDGIYNQYTADMISSSSANTSAADKLQSTLENKNYSKSTDEELMNVCKEFESYFVEQVFKSLEKMVPENEEENSSSMSSYKEYFGDMLTQEYAAAATESDNGRGLGIAQMLYEQMKRNYNM